MPGLRPRFLRRSAPLKDSLGEEPGIRDQESGEWFKSPLCGCVMRGACPARSLFKERLPRLEHHGACPVNTMGLARRENLAAQPATANLPSNNNRPTT